MFNSREQFFSEYSTYLFQESSCSFPFLSGYGIFLEEHLHAWISYYNVFDGYFYLERSVISKEHLQLDIWVVPSLFQEITCGDRVFSRVLYFFERNTCSHPFSQRYWLNLQFQLQPSIRWLVLFSIIKEQLQPRILSNFLSFCRTGILVFYNYIMVTNFDTSLLWYIISCSRPFSLW